MAQQRRGLGKGLGALIPDAQRANQGAVGSAGAVGAVDTAYPQSTVGVIPSDYSADTAGRRPSGDGDAGLRPVDGAYFEEVAIDSIAPNPRQPRLTFDDWPSRRDPRGRGDEARILISLRSWSS